MLRALGVLYIWITRALLVQSQVRNLPPKFVTGFSMLDLVIREDTPVGTQIYQVRATDPDGDVVYYSISGDLVSIDRVTGSVTLVGSVDRELALSVEVILTLTDDPGDGSEPHIVSVRRLIPVLDANDNAPVFNDAVNGVYKFSVAETAEVGSTVFSRINITDADYGANGEISLKCDHSTTNYGCERFDVRGVELSNGVFVGLVTIKTALDYETQKLFDLNVLALDAGNPQMTSSARMLISVEDAQDQPPIFINGPYTAYLPENSPESTAVLEIIVQDGDTGAPRDLNLTLAGDEQGYFQLTKPNRGVSGVYTTRLVTSGRSIDREDDVILNSAGIYKFSIQAKEITENGLTGSSTLSNITIVVRDENDSPPVFNQHQFNITIPENIGARSPLPGIEMIVSDSDVGDYSTFSLAIEDVLNSEGVFEVFPKVVHSQTSVTITVIEPERLNHEHENGRHFVFDVVARQAEYRASARVNLHVTDANDNAPLFEKSQYRLEVPEDAAEGYLLGQITATDPDSGVNGKLEYRMVGFEAGRFLVDQDGRIQLAPCGNITCLDYEHQKNYHLQLESTDGGNMSATAAILVAVIDTNDNRPTFSQREFRRTLDINATQFLPEFFIEATDEDSGANGAILFSFLEGNDEGMFEIESDTGEILLAVNWRESHAGLVNRSSAVHTLIVEARDKGTPSLSSTVRVVIAIGHNTNQPPEFSSQLYRVKILENTTALTEVLLLQALDPDGSSDLITFSLFSGGKDNFIVTPDGYVLTSKDCRLDLESDGSTSYTLKVMVSDSGRPVARSLSTVLVSVQDVNDESPSFRPAAYIEHIPEAAEVGQRVVRVRAVDPDSSADLQFAIVSPVLARDKSGVKVDTASTNIARWFSMNSTTGLVQVASALDFNVAAFIQLTIQVSDLGSDTGLQYHRGKVTIFLQTTTDNYPQFEPPWLPSHPEIPLFVDEEQSLGSNVFTLKARDPVSGESVTDFQEIATSDTEGWFAIDGRVGEIMVKRRLDFDTMQHKELKLRVRAISGGRSSQATVLISVQDINDNHPVFSEKVYRANVSEAHFYPHEVVRVSAVDADYQHGYGNVTYSLAGVTADQFTVNPLSGVVQVAAGTVLDRESVPIHTLRVLAQDNPDNGQEPHRSAARLVIRVDDINDNSPVFDRGSEVSGLVSEEASIGTRVLLVSASDRDVGENGGVSYHLSHQTVDLFELDEATGELRVSSSLTGRGRQEPYVIRIEAQDNGEEPLKTEMELKVYIAGVGYNTGVPRFIKPQPGDQATIQENLPEGTFVYQARAEDPDDSRLDSGRLRYSFLGTVQADRTKYFIIDERTGSITSRQVLDREQKSYHDLMLAVTDLAVPSHQATTKLRVQVADVDDVEPHFIRAEDSRPIEQFVSEDEEVGFVVAHVQAIDEDSAQFNRTLYRITEGNESGMFGVRSTDHGTAEIFLLKEMDRETREEYLLTLQCYSAGTIPEAKSEYDPKDLSMVHVRIFAVDSDDNGPLFQQSFITRGVRTSTPYGTAIALLTATDPDGGSNQVSYRIEEISFSRKQEEAAGNHTVTPSVTHSFAIDRVTGELRSQESMTQYSAGYFNITVAATSGSKSSTATVQVYVLDDASALKLIFSSASADVHHVLPQFTSLVEQSLPVSARLMPSEVNHGDESYQDTAKTGLCFQLMNEGQVISFDDAANLLDTTSNRPLAKLFTHYHVESVEPCSSMQIGTRFGFTLVQILIMAVGVVIALFTVSAIFFLSCCRKTNYSEMSRKSSQVPSGGSRPQVAGNGQAARSRIGSVSSGIRDAPTLRATHLPPLGSVHNYGFPTPPPSAGHSQFGEARYIAR